MLFMTRRPKACRRALQLDFYNMDFESKICKEEKNLKGQMLGTKSFCVLSTLTANIFNTMNALNAEQLESLSKSSSTC